MTSDTSRLKPEQLEARSAASTGVIFFDLSDRTQIEVTGADRTRFLHSFTTSDIKSLKPGQGCETFLTSLKGKVVAHFYVFCFENSLWLDGTPGQEEAILAHLTKFVLIDDVQFNRCSSTYGELFVSGPLAAQLLQLDNGLTLCRHELRQSDARTVDFRRVDLLGSPGFLMSMPREQLDAVKQSLSAFGIAEGSQELFELLRIEAGYPTCGKDITEDYLAQEVARTKQCVSFNKGCYLGQETVARLDALGHTNRELRRLQFDSSDAPQPGTAIFDSTGTNELGTITSAAVDFGQSPSDTRSSVVAIGMLKRAALQPDTALIIKIGDQTVTGRVLG